MEELSLHLALRGAGCIGKLLLFNSLPAPCRPCLTWMFKPAQWQHYHGDSLMLERCFSSKASPLGHLHIPRGILKTRLAKTLLRPICRELWRHPAPWFSLAAAPLYPCSTSRPLWERPRTHFLPRSVFFPQRHLS